MKNKIISFIKTWSIPVCLLACISLFIFRFVTSEENSSQRWCENCNTFHDINDDTIEEVWCNNCNTWHAPKDESSNNHLIQ